MEIDKSKMYDERGYPMTQALFLEAVYKDCAVYTLKDRDYEYEGRLLPSIRRLYLEIADPTEYEFANTCFIGWKHWLRIQENKFLSTHIAEWREELEYKLRSKAAKQMFDAATGGNYQAIKWLADKGWKTGKGAGRPTKEDVAQEKAFAARISEEYSGDVVRLANYK